MEGSEYSSHENSQLDGHDGRETLASTSQPAKPPRRFHAKTRTGCNVCKRRKVKCDEQHPSCRNCIKRGVECNYEMTHQLSIRSSPNAEPDVNLTDLELLHNFTTMTCNTMVENAVIRNLWKFGIVRMAVENKYLMRGILAVSALHMAHHRPQEKHLYVAYAVQQHRIASQMAVELMADIKLENCEALWVFSILTIYYALGNPKEDNAKLMTGAKLFPDWLFLLDGIRPLLETFSSESYTGVLHPILDRGRKRWEASHAPQYAKSTILEDLESCIRSTVDDQHLVEIYCRAIDELRPHLSYTLLAPNQTLDTTDAFVWHYTLDDEFIALLQAPAQEAVAIFAHFCIMLSRSQRNWWLQGWDTFLISRVWEILDAEHRLWIQWPLEEIGWVPPPSGAKC